MQPEIAPTPGHALPAVTPPSPPADGPDEIDESGLPRDISPEVQRLVEECWALEDAYPPPDARDVFADGRWTEAADAAGELDQYHGTYVAVADRQVCATGETDIETRVKAARACGRHPERFWVVYLHPRYRDD